MYCQYCGTELNDNTKYCHECGAPQASEYSHTTVNQDSQATAPQKGKGLCIAGMVLGIVSVAISGLVPGIVGLVLSIVGKNKINDKTSTYHKFALAGFVTAIVGIVLGSAYTLY